MKATVENLRGSLEKLSQCAVWSVKGSHTVLRGSVRAPEEFSEGRPKAAKPRGPRPQGFSANGFPRKILREPSHCPAAQCWHQRNSPEGTVFSTLSQEFSTVAQTIKTMRFNC